MTEKTIQERNDAAIVLLQDGFQQMLDTRKVNFTYRDLIEFSEAINTFYSETDNASYPSVVMFLMDIINYSNPGEKANLIPRFKSLKLENGYKNALRDWKNRFQMGK
jgi:hypothetical protein